MITKSTKQIATLSSLFFIGMIAVLVVAYGQLSRMGFLLESRAIEVATNEALLQRTMEITTLEIETKAEREQLHRYILNEDEIVNFLAATEAEAAAQGVAFSTASLQQLDTTDTQFDTVNVTFKLAGDEAAILRILEMLETLPYDSMITGFSLDRLGGEVEGEIQLAVNILTS